MKIFRILVVISFILILALTSYADHERFFPTGAYNHLSVAQMGMGGLTTVVSNGSHSIFYNPAHLSEQKFDFAVIPGSYGVKNNFVEVLQFLDDHGEEFSQLDSLVVHSPQQVDDFLEDSQKFDDEWFGQHFSPYIGMVLNGFGAAAYGHAVSDIKLDQGVFIPAAAARGYMDIVVGGGYGKKMDLWGSEWDVGAALRMTYRRYVSYVRVSATDVASQQEVIDTIMDEMTDTNVGVGVDIGMIRTLGDDGPMDVAIVCQDLIGVMDGWVKPNIKLGGMYHVPFAGNMLLKQWDFGMEYVDIFNRTGTSAFQKINLGTELSVMSGFFSLRGGFHQGYPTFGAGLNLFVLRFDYAYYTREMGTAPGMIEDLTHRFQFSIRL